MTGERLRVGLLATHPIQYYSPWYRGLAREVDLHVFYSHRQDAGGQAAAGYGVAFDWDVPLVDGFASTFLRNTAGRPSVDTFWGCRTPDLPGIIRASRFDAFIVHGWATWSYWQAITACWRTGTPVLVRGDSTLGTPRAGWWRALKQPVYRAFIPRFDAYLVVGDRARDYLTHYGADPARCYEAPHAVDNAFFAAAAAELRPMRAHLRHDFDVPDDATVFLSVGRLIDIKRIEVFVAALGRAARTAPRAAGLIVGDGPLKPSLEALARRAGAPVRFAGFLNQGAIGRAYAAADVLVLPSRSETWGLVVNEAMASGLPAIVSTGVGCAGSLVRPGETGEIFPEGDVDALADHLTALATQADVRARLAEGARRHVARFDVPVAVAGTVRALRAVTAGRARPAVSPSSMAHDGVTK
jgi:glycosyltransferase involved in cell wall biosynthesis